jgi:signal transduction histidine kinase
MKMRTKLLLALLSVSFGLTAAILFVIRTNLEHQIRVRILDDLNSSVNTFHNLEEQRQQMLLHDTALLADLPTLKALMTSADRRTIRDGGEEFWRVSGSDLLALADAEGETVAIYNDGAPLNEGVAGAALQQAIRRSADFEYLVIDGRLYEISIEPLYFGPIASGTRLGYVVSGFEINQRVAQEVRQAAAAEVAFCINGAVVASTLDKNHRTVLAQDLSRLPLADGGSNDIWLGREHFVVASGLLQNEGSPPVQLLVLKSYDQASLFLRQLNRLIGLLGLFVIVAGGMLAVYLAQSITRPLESLAAGAIALGTGDFDRELTGNGGGKEIGDLSLAFDRMRLHLRQTQEELLDAERLATIGRMARSISHDLRHHLSTIYANAEFLSYPTTGKKDRIELLGEVRMAAQEMTELIDSLLMFSSTGKTLHLTLEVFSFVVERAAALVRPHPEAAGVEIQVEMAVSADERGGIDVPSEIWMDVKKVERVIYNLVLNACQAARRSAQQPRVSISLSEDLDWERLRIQDNGPGVSDSIRLTLFEPFVSEGKQNGLGLGLTLADCIAQEHSGSVRLEESGPDGSVFIFSIPRNLHRDREVSPMRPDNRGMLAAEAPPEPTESASSTLNRRESP